MLTVGRPRHREAAIAEIVSQLAVAKLATSGHRLTASQLHAPGLVLVGDAGHGVTPRTGNGMNAALEDSQMLGLLLAEALEDPDPAAALERLPAAFTAARMADAQALLYLDGEFPRRVGATARPWSLPSLALRISTVARLLLHRATGGRVAKPAWMRLQSARIVPYRQIAMQLRRDDWLVGAATAAAGAMALVGILTLVMRSQ